MEAIPEGALGATYVFHAHSLGKEILFLGHGNLDTVKIFWENIDILCFFGRIYTNIKYLGANTSAVPDVDCRGMESGEDDID